MLKYYKLKNYRFRLVIFVLLLSAIGVIMIGSADASYQNRQIIGICIGLVAMVVLSLIDYNIIEFFWWFWYLLAIGLLIAVLFAGESSSGATRWIEIGGIQFQPSDLAKLFIILFFASFLMRFEKRLNTLPFILICIGLIAVPTYLIYLEPNLSTTIIMILIFVSLLFIAGLSYKIVAGVIVIGVPAFIVVLILTINKIIPLREYQYNRIMAWVDPANYSDNAYQQQYSISAIGSGQLWGKGLSNSSFASVKNGNFVSESHTDFIFAIIGEELGFIGCLVVLILLSLIVVECILAARKALNLSGKLICSGVAAWIGFQGIINIGVATGLIPNTGVTLPFVSYGLTSLVSLYMAIGIVLNIRLQAGISKRDYKVRWRQRGGSL